MVLRRTGKVDGQSGHLLAAVCGAVGRGIEGACDELQETWLPRPTA